MCNGFLWSQKWINITNSLWILDLVRWSAVIVLSQTQTYEDNSFVERWEGRELPFDF